MTRHFYCRIAGMLANVVSGVGGSGDDDVLLSREVDVKKKNMTAG